MRLSTDILLKSKLFDAHSQTSPQIVHKKNKHDIDRSDWRRGLFETQ